MKGENMSNQKTLVETLTERARWYLGGNYDGGEATYQFWYDRTRELISDPPVNQYWTTEQSVRFTLADELKEHFETIGYDANDAHGSNFLGDILNLAVAFIDFDALAEHLIESAKE